MNNFTVQICQKANNVYKDYTKNAVFPLKIANFLDEQLDEIELQLKHTDVEYFNPLAIVAITLINSPNAKYVSKADIESRTVNSDVVITYDSTTKRITETLTRYFLIATDNAIEQIALEKNGVKRYDHTLYLIETTKFAEGFIGEPLTFTNALGNDFTGENTPINPPANASTARIMNQGVGTPDGQYVSAIWFTNVEIPVGSTVYYGGSTAEVITSSWSGSSGSVVLRYLATSAFVGAMGQGYITVLFA